MSCLQAVRGSDTNTGLKLWITRPRATALWLRFDIFALPMQEVASHTDYKALYEESQLIITQLRLPLHRQQQRFSRQQNTGTTPSKLEIYGINSYEA
jgi:hypothetical protein